MDVLCGRTYPLRRRGRRLPWREVINALSFEGDLGNHYLALKDARYFVAKLVAPGDALCTPLLPELYEPRTDEHRERAIGFTRI